MRKFKTRFPVKELAARIPGKAIILEDLLLDNVSELTEADRNSVCFFENPRYLPALLQSEAGLIIVPSDFDPALKKNSNLVLTEKPYLTFMLMVRTWLSMEKHNFQPSISANACISPEAVLGKNISIGENVGIRSGSKIGDHTLIEENVILMENVRIGTNCHIYPNVTLYENTVIGNNVIIHAGCVIGADGFGYQLYNGIQEKIPQVGNVIIGDDVEIGANTTIDRATLGSTCIGRGTKIDNLVQIGHNCIIGEHTIICAQVGLAGGTRIGDQVYLAGQVGVAGHLKINDGAMVGAQSGVSGDVAASAKVFGSPALEAGLRKRIIASEKKLPDLVKAYNRANRDREKQDER
ncbi:MAG: UDP-3-O-(3-hydroxymyristoyl)glucosamine N-acyltransferase [Candidatus Cloacimonetes bacterium]|nr:UDP-3-O-(3-hydroxymyristoyl)glucosamine N-acyltransferase [Candidatus Cloacimonadota bacterium]